MLNVKCLFMYNLLQNIVGSSSNPQRLKTKLYTHSGSFLSLLDFFGEAVETDITENKKK